MRKRNLFKTILMFSAIVFGGTLISCRTNNDDTGDFDVSNVEQTDQVDDNTSNPTEPEDPIGQDNQDNSDPTDLVETATLIGIEVTTLPVTTYYVGETFDDTGMVVTAYYSNGSFKEVTGYTIEDPDMTSVGSQTLTVTYTENSISVTTTFEITVVEEVTLDRIYVTTEPTKTTYYVGETFDDTGMVVTAYYSNGFFKEVTGYTVEAPDMTKVGTNEGSVTYSEGGITVNTTFSITVIEPEYF